MVGISMSFRFKFAAILMFSLNFVPLANVDSLTEDTLFQLWSKSLPRNELDPLITRVTDQVIALKN